MEMEWLEMADSYFMLKTTSPTTTTAATMLTTATSTTTTSLPKQETKLNWIFVCKEKFLCNSLFCFREIMDLSFFGFLCQSFRLRNWAAKVTCAEVSYFHVFRAKFVLKMVPLTRQVTEDCSCFAVKPTNEGASVPNFTNSFSKMCFPSYLSQIL